nr:hypothetical protein BaRGS_013511 [Batillaria attramentaria]
MFVDNDSTFYTRTGKRYPKLSATLAVPSSGEPQPDTTHVVVIFIRAEEGHCAAFDTLDHSVMLRRLEITFGVRDLRNAPTLSVFKSSLKTFLFRKAYQ